MQTVNLRIGRSTVGMTPSMRATPSKPLRIERDGGGKPWVCGDCHVTVNKKDVVAGTAEIVGQTVVCEGCLSKRRKREKIARTQRLTPWGLAGATLITFAAGAVFAPACLLLIFSAIGALASLGALLHSEARAFLRTMVFVSGVMVCVSGFNYSDRFKQAMLSRSDYERFAPRIALLRDTLNKDDYAEAVKSFGEWSRMVYSAPGQFSSAGAQHAFQDAEKVFDQWIDGRFPDTGLREHELMRRLLSEYSYKVQSGSRRFSSLRASNGGLTMSAFVDAAESDRAGCRSRG